MLFYKDYNQAILLGICPLKLTKLWNISQTTYNNLTVDIKVTHLLAVLHDGTVKEDARLMAAVLLRRLFSSDFQEFYVAVSIFFLIINN